MPILRDLRRKLTFRGVEDRMIHLETIMYNFSINLNAKETISSKELLHELLDIRNTIVEKHQSLYVSEINNLINRVRLFGYYFATLDIRQDSRIHHSVFTTVIDHLNRNRASSISKKLS